MKLLKIAAYTVPALLAGTMAAHAEPISTALAVAATFFGSGTLAATLASYPICGDVVIA